MNSEIERLLATWRREMERLGPALFPKWFLDFYFSEEGGALSFDAAALARARTLGEALAAIRPAEADPMPDFYPPGTKKARALLKSVSRGQECVKAAAAYCLAAWGRPAAEEWLIDWTAEVRRRLHESRLSAESALQAAWLEWDRTREFKTQQEMADWCGCTRKTVQKMLKPKDGRAKRTSTGYRLTK